jgi:hypothetical protein
VGQRHHERARLGERQSQYDGVPGAVVEPEPHDLSVTRGITGRQLGAFDFHQVDRRISIAIETLHAASSDDRRT